MRKLILLFLICSGLFSCKTKQFLKRESISQTIINPYFSNPDLDYIYQAKIDVFSNQFTGVFIVKRIDDKQHRMVLTSDFGNTLIDLSLTESDHQVNYVLNDLNKKILIKTLVNDFRILLQTNLVAISKENLNDETIYYVDKKKEFLKYFYEIANNELKRIHLLKKNKEIVTFEFNEIQQDLSSTIKIEHKNWPIKIYLIKQ